MMRRFVMWHYLGWFGGQLNATDGRYVYMKSPVDWDEPIYQYTLMPMRHGENVDLSRTRS